MRSIALLVLGVACQPGDDTGESGVPPDDTPPVIVHEPVSGTVPVGEDVTLTATVTDDGGVLFVFVYYQDDWYPNEGEEEWATFFAVWDGDPDQYTATLPGEVAPAGVTAYYFEAVDKAQNAVYAPTEGPDDPYQFRRE